MATESKVNCTFVSEKISKVRWLPEQYNAAESFVTGSWDSKLNNVKLWKLVPNEYSDDDTEIIPKSFAKLQFPGDITGLELIDYDNIAISSSDGW